jgi:predicted nucleic acid-binding protein
MGVIVDTIIWSLALRRNTPEINAAVVQQLRSLIAAQQVILLGAVRQEILSGLRTPEQFERLRGILQAFPNLDLVAEDYELAAEFFNTCRRNGSRVQTPIFSFVPSPIAANMLFSLPIMTFGIFKPICRSGYLSNKTFQQSRSADSAHTVCAFPMSRLSLHCGDN